MAEQSGELCELGSASLEVELPELLPLPLSADGTLWRLTSKGVLGGPWSITVVPQGDAGTPLEIARVESRDAGEGRVLTLTLLAVPEAGDAALWATAREALTTAPLVLRPPGMTSVEFETFVQLCTPKQLPAIEFANLLTDDAWLPKGKKPGQPLEQDPLPPTPWPCRVELEGRGSGGITAKIVAKASDAPPEPAALASRLRPEALEVTARWTWPGAETEREKKQEKKAESPPDAGEFMTTTLVMENQAIDPTLGGWRFTARVTDSQVLPPWDSWKYLGDPKELLARERAEPLARERAEPLTHLSVQFQERLERLLKGGDSIPPKTLAEFGPMAAKRSPDWKPGKLSDILSNAERASRSLNQFSSPSWEDTIRVALVHTRGYQQWVETKLPPKPPLPKPTDPRNPREFAEAKQEYAKKLEEWQADVARQKKEGYFPATGVPEVQLRLFWKDVEQELKKPADQRKLILDPESIALCCLYEELDGVLQKKRQAKELLDAVGDGTVTFTGRVLAEATLSGPHRVLLAEFGDEPKEGTSGKKDKVPAEKQEADEAAAANDTNPPSPD